MSGYLNENDIIRFEYISHNKGHKQKGYREGSVGSRGDRRSGEHNSYNGNPKLWAEQAAGETDKLHDYKTIICKTIFDTNLLRVWVTQHYVGATVNSIQYTKFWKHLFNIMVWIVLIKSSIMCCENRDVTKLKWMRQSIWKSE